MERCNFCNEELVELSYYYDDDWGHKGNRVWDRYGTEKKLCHCPKCGLVYALESDRGEK